MFISLAFRRVLYFSVFCLFLTNCRQRLSDADFVFLNGSEPQGLDPAIVSGQLETRLCNALFEGLTARGADGVARPGAAESWKVSENGLRYTFTIRSNAQWSNGDPVTAFDFEQSWRRVLEPATASRYAEIMFFIKNAEDYHAGRLKDFSQVGVHALNERTLQVDLESPTVYFPDVLAFTTYLPVHMPTVRRYGDRWTRPGKMISNGAYVLKRWRINDRIRLEKNPHYWRQETVAFRSIDVLTVSKASTAFNLYATGQADLILDKGLVPAVLIGELKTRSDFHANPFLATYFYRFNTTKPPLDDARVRKALALAVDKQRIVDKIAKAGERPAFSLTPPGIPGYEPPDGLTYDPKKARELLAEAGFSHGKGFPRLTLLYNKTELNEQIATEVQAMWNETLGIHVELRNQEWATYLRSLNELDYDIARSSWVGDYNDPNTFLDCFLTDRGNNRTGWSNARYDQLMKRANKESDADARFSLMRQAETILAQDELPILPLYFFAGVNFYDGEKLGGIQPNVVDEHPLRAMYWKNK